MDAKTQFALFSSCVENKKTKVKIPLIFLVHRREFANIRLFPVGLQRAADSTAQFFARSNVRAVATVCSAHRLHEVHPKTLFEIAMVLSTNSGSFPSNSHVSAAFSILLRFGESWNPTNCEKFNADGSQMGRTNLDKSVW